MRYATLSIRELLVIAEADPFYGRDPLFTELVCRLSGQNSNLVLVNPDRVIGQRKAPANVRQ